MHAQVKASYKLSPELKKTLPRKPRAKKPAADSAAAVEEGTTAEEPKPAATKVKHWLYVSLADPAATFGPILNASLNSSCH